MAEIYVYRSVRSDGARDLARALGGRRVLEVPRLMRGDTIVCWGTPVGGVPAGVKVLNNVALHNKYEDALTLKAKNIPTIEVALRLPNPVVAVHEPVAVNNGDVRNLWRNVMDHANDFVENEEPNFGSPVFRRGIVEFKGALDNFARSLGEARVVARAVEAPAANAEWLGRRFYHVGGKDLLNLNNNKPPQYFARKEDIVEEFRVHSFLGKSIRAGKKVVREDVPAHRRHAWVRSWDGGWKMAYEGVKATPEIRNLAHSAVAALDLDFGAVDIGKLRNGRFIVLEVNRAPGIEGGTIVKYKEAIERWMAGA